MKKQMCAALLCLFAAVLAAETNLEELAKSVAADKNTRAPGDAAAPGLVYTISIQTMEDIKELYRESPYMLSIPVRQILERAGDISCADLFALLNSDRAYILDQFFSMSLADGSYQKIRSASANIGEAAFFTPHDGLFVSDPFSYGLFLLDDGAVCRFELQTDIAGNYDALDRVWTAFPELTYKKDGYWYWKSRSSLYAFVQLMEAHDERLPAELLELQTAWEYIAGHLEIDGERAVFCGGAPGPDIRLNAVMTVSDNLRLRTAEGLESPALVTLAAGSRVKIRAFGRAAFIDGIISYWVRAEVLPGAQDTDGHAVPAGTTGWCFGDYAE